MTYVDLISQVNYAMFKGATAQFWPQDGCQRKSHPRQLDFRGGMTKWMTSQKWRRGRLLLRARRRRRKL